MALWKEHWTPAYIRDKLAVMRWEKANTDKPWLVRAAVEAMADLVRPGDVVVEFGSGRSTAWFSRRVGPSGKVISVEDYRPWYDKVGAELAAAKISNVEYLFVGQTPAEYLAPATAAVERLEGRIDVALADGFKHRDHAALWAIERVRPGGMVIIDNVNWYLPHATRTPGSLGQNGRPATELWSKFAELTCEWRFAWFTSGVSDTAIFFAPPSVNTSDPTVHVRSVSAASLSAR